MMLALSRGEGCIDFLHVGLKFYSALVSRVDRG